MINPNKIEADIKQTYRERLLEGWGATLDNQYFLSYHRRYLYTLVKELRWHSNPGTRLLKSLEAEALAEFLEDYDKES
jgi:hypothetical protein